MDAQTLLSVTLYVIACLVIVLWSSRRMQEWLLILRLQQLPSTFFLVCLNNVNESFDI
jgi:hypothetical protein